MFDKVEYRYALRCFLVGFAAFLSALQASNFGSDLHWDELIQALISGGIAALVYAGIGAASGAVEPSIGNKRP